MRDIIIYRDIVIYYFCKGAQVSHLPYIINLNKISHKNFLFLWFKYALKNSQTVFSKSNWSCPANLMWGTTSASGLVLLPIYFKTRRFYHNYPTIHTLTSTKRTQKTTKKYYGPMRGVDTVGESMNLKISRKITFM